MADLDNRRIGLGQRPALLVIDASIAFTDPACPLGGDYGAELQQIAHLLSVFRAQSLPVYYTTNLFRSEQQGRVFREKLPVLNLLQPDTRLVEINPVVAPAAGETVIEKALPSAFFETPLRSLLVADKVDSLVLTGFTTSGCVRASAVDALSSGYYTIVAREAVGDRNPEAHLANLHDIEAKYGQVLSCREIADSVRNLRA